MNKMNKKESSRPNRNSKVDNQQRDYVVIFVLTRKEVSEAYFLRLIKKVYY